MSGSGSIEPLFKAFVSGCRSLLDRVVSQQDQSLRLFLHPAERVRWLATHAEATPQFLDFIRALPVPNDEVIAGWVGLQRLPWDSSSMKCCGWFLRNVGFYHHLVDGQQPSLINLLHRWSSQTWGSRRLYLLNGLSIDEPGVVVGDARIRHLMESDLEGVFRNRTRSAFGEVVDLKPLIGQAFLDLPLATMDLEDFYYGPDRSHPFLAYLNLQSARNVSLAATYEFPTPDAWGLDYISDVTGLRPWELTAAKPEPGSSCRLQAFVDEMEAGRSAAASHRVEVALKCYARACKALAFAGCGEEPLGGDPEQDAGGLEVAQDCEALERAVLDLATTMEAIFLDTSPRQKTARLVTRAGALLSLSDGDTLATQERIREAYDTRSRLVHGDTIPTYRQLYGTAAFLRRCSRRSLVALLRLKGQQEQIIVGVADASARSRNRLLVPE